MAPVVPTQGVVPVSKPPFTISSEPGLGTEPTESVAVLLVTVWLAASRTTAWYLLPLSVL